MTLQTDHTLFIILTLAVCLLAALFGGLHIAAAAVQLSKDHKPSHIVMMIAGAVCVLAAVSCLFGGLFGFGGPNLDSVLMAIGGGAVCGAAWWNGKSGGSFHLAHHLIRLGIVLILVFTFIRV